MAKGLSPKQKEVLAAVSAWREKHRRAPTVRELAAALSLSSTATVHQHLSALTAKGYLTRTRYRHRGLRACSPPIHGRFGDEQAAVQRVPLLGAIVAGRPLEAVEVRDDDETIELPATFLSAGEHFALRVTGDSMIDDGILNGDVIVVRRQSTAEIGQAVVALIDGEATVKRLYFHGSQAELRPANAAMDSIYVSRDALTLQGVVVSLLRSYR